MNLHTETSIIVQTNGTPDKAFYYWICQQIVQKMSSLFLKIFLDRDKYPNMGH